MEENLFLEETQKTVLQSQDLVEHDPNAALRNPDGYTPVGEGEDNTPVVEVEPNNIGEVSATTPVSTRQVSDLPPETYGGTGDFLINPEEEIAEDTSEDLELIPLTETPNVRFQTLSNLDSGSDIIDDNPVDSETPNEVVEPPESSEPEDEPATPLVPEEPTPEPPTPEEPEPEPPAPPEPEEPENPEPEDPDPEEPEPEDPEEPEEPEDPDPEEPEPPTPEEPSGQNPGNNKDVGNSPFDGITGNSGNNGDRTPPGGPMEGGEDDIGEQPGWKGNGPSNSNGNRNFSDDDLVSRFLEENPQDNDDLDLYNFDDNSPSDLDIPQELMVEFPDIPEYGMDYSIDMVDYDF